MTNKSNAVDPSPYAGFWGTDSETYYFTPTGRVWLVQSEDALLEPREMTHVLSGITRVDEMVTPEEAIGWCRQIERLSGEKLLSDD